MIKCPVCSNDEGIIHEVIEMMYGTKKKYKYNECLFCGTLYLLDGTNNSEEQENKLYPKDYYSFNLQKRVNNLFINFLKIKRANYVLRKKNFIGFILQKIKPILIPQWILLSKLTRINSRILDVGCGSGGLLFYLKQLGFNNLTGIDPNVPKEFFDSRIKIKKITLDMLSGEYDYIMFHHVFEHMDRPFEILKEVYQRLSEDGIVIVRIPVKDNFIWEKYGPYWIQLDAPRHKVIYTKHSFSELSKQAGFRVEFFYCDSTAFQFWGSEQNKRGISLFAPNSYSVDKNASVFKEQEIIEYQERAKELNKNAFGDQAVFILKKIDAII